MHPGTEDRNDVPVRDRLAASQLEGRPDVAKHESRLRSSEERTALRDL